MKKKVYKLKGDSKYEFPVNATNKAYYDFRLHVNKRKLQSSIDSRNELIKKYNKKPKRVDSSASVLLLMVLYYLFIGILVLLSKLGI